MYLICTQGVDHAGPGAALVPRAETGLGGWPAGGAWEAGNVAFCCLWLSGFVTANLNLRDLAERLKP
jgi:hypothetical protein